MELWKNLEWPNQEWLLRHVATSLQSLDDEAKQEFSDANGFKIVTDLLQIVTTASDERQIPCHYGGLLESNLYKEQADEAAKRLAQPRAAFEECGDKPTEPGRWSKARIQRLLIIILKASDDHIVTRPSASRTNISF